MDKKAESVKVVVILSAAFILIGLGFVVFSRMPTVNSQATYSAKACYILEDGRLSTADVSLCCAEMKKSTGCRPYVSQNMNDELVICQGQFSVVMNKETIGFCG